MITVSKETAVAAVPLIAAGRRVATTATVSNLVGLQLRTSLDESEAG